MTWPTSRIDRRLVLSGTRQDVAFTHGAAFLAPDYNSLMALRLVMLAIAAIFTPLALGTVALIVPQK
jgi:MFS transporter, DHA1 family, inner membrane transport protein